jgi:prepilin peptidase CpaA
MLTPIDINGLTIVALGVLLTAVVWNDITTHRIENVSVLAIILLGLISQLLGNGAPGVVNWFAGMAVGLGFMLPFYIAGGMAAGDVKLLAAIGSILGPLPTVVAGGVALVAGLVLAVFAFAKHRYQQKITEASTSPRDRNSTDSPIPFRKQRLPYAAAIAAGTIGGLVYSGRLQTFFGVFV